MEKFMEKFGANTDHLGQIVTTNDKVADSKDDDLRKQMSELAKKRLSSRSEKQQPQS